MEIKHIDKYGDRRPGVINTCPTCKAEFITPKSRQRKYCSKLCQNVNVNKQVKLVCLQCKTEFKRQASRASKTVFHFCSRACKDEAQRIGGIKGIMPPHYGAGKTVASETYRKYYKIFYKLSKLFCRRCGYCEFEGGIDVHHIDQDRNNNTKENLIALCSPCHRALHSKLWTIKDLKIFD